MAETSTIFGFMKYVSATDILSDFKKTVDSYFVNSLKTWNYPSLIEHSSFDDISYDDLELLNLFYGYESHLE